MNTPTLQDAIALAGMAHAGQTDKAGAPYFEHVLRVMNSVEGEEAQIVAVLHDTIEDTFVTAEFLRDVGYSDAIITAIEALSKQPDEESSDAGYEKFICRAAQNPLACKVKVADLKDNMDLSRIAHPTAKDHARIAKYQKALEHLESLAIDGSTPGDKP